MYGIFSYIYHKFMPNVGKYSRRPPHHHHPCSRRPPHHHFPCSRRPPHHHLPCSRVPPHHHLPCSRRPPHHLPCSRLSHRLSQPGWRQNTPCTLTALEALHSRPRCSAERVRVLLFDLLEVKRNRDVFGRGTLHIFPGFRTDLHMAFICP